MKTCPVCALDLEDAYLFCPDDGSSLGTVPSGPSEIGSEGAGESDHDTASPVVLYCPACAAEYPLTFSECPVHGVQLTKHQIPRLSNFERDLRKRDQAADAEAIVSGVQFQRDQSNLRKHLTIPDLKRPQIESPRRQAATEVVNNNAESLQDAAVTPRASAPFDLLAAVPVGAFATDNTAVGYQGPVTDTHEQGFERPAFRVAAIATIIALVVFGLVATYTFVSRTPRRSSSPPVQVASKMESAPQPLPFVPTPQEAQDYKEEAPVPAVSTSPESQPERPAERARNETAFSSPTDQSVRKTTVAQPLPKPQAKTPPPPPVTTTRVSNPPMPALPRGNSGGFDARLIRVRSRKTAAGFRYDLTFNLQEQAGRSAQWQRVLINTRSASGMSHSEAIPFSHRLGATGALTFTISVELTGRSESDWQGRIVCTTLGWDNNGAPLQASFGANVTP